MTAPFAVPPAEPLPEIKRGVYCSCWGADGWPPCAPGTCDPRCGACAAAEGPFLSREEVRFLERGGGPLAAELARLWAAKDQQKSGSGRGGNPARIVCAHGHPKPAGGSCQGCHNTRRRRRRAQARQGNAAAGAGPDG